jgi:hypothetical protein
MMEKKKKILRRVENWQRARVQNDVDVGDANIRLAYTGAFIKPYTHLIMPIQSD